MNKLKKHISVFLSLAILLTLLPSGTLCLTAYAQRSRVSVFDDTQKKTKADGKFEKIQEETLAALLSQSYMLQSTVLYNVKEYAAEHGFEPLEPSYRDNYSTDELLDIYKGLYKRLLKVDREALTDRNKFGYDFLKNFLETEELKRGIDESFFSSFDPTTGAHLRALTPLKANVGSEQDINEIIDVMSGYYDYASEMCERELARLDKGISLTQGQLDSAIAMCWNALDAKYEYYGSVDEILDKLPLSDGEKEDYTGKFAEILDNVILPAYELMIETLEKIKEADIEPKGTAAYEGGGKYFEYLLRSVCGINEDIDELLDEVYSDIRDSSDGLSDIEDLPELYEPYGEFLIEMTPGEIMEFIAGAAAEDFDLRFSADYSILTAASSDSGAMGAYIITPVGDPSNVITVTGEYIDDSADLAAALAHEGIPGHMYHFNYMTENASDLQNIVARLNERPDGYIEGWASAVEGFIFDHIGMNETQKEYKLLRTFMSYAANSYIPLLANGRGYSLDELCEEYGRDTDELYDDYLFAVENPLGQMKYYIGIKKFNAAREKAESALGSRFDEKEYHAFLMDIGIADFDTLDKWEELWIEKVLAGEDMNEGGEEIPEEVIEGSPEEVVEEAPEDMPEENTPQESDVQAADNGNPVTGTGICFGYVMICAAAVFVSGKKKVK